VVAVRMRTAGQQALRGRTVHEGPGMTMPGAAACAVAARAAQHRRPLRRGVVVRRSLAVPCSSLLLSQSPQQFIQQSLKQFPRQFIASGCNPHPTWLFADLIPSLSCLLAALSHSLREWPGHACAADVMHRREPRVQASSGMDIAGGKAGMAVVWPVRGHLARQDGGVLQLQRMVSGTRRGIASRAISA